MKKKKPYKYNSKSRLTPNSQSFPFKVNNIKNDVVTNLENTLTKLRIIEEVPEKKETLDDGFLEGRFDRKEDKKKKNNSLSKKENYVSLLTSLRKIVLSISAIGAILIVIMLSYHFIEGISSHYHQESKKRLTAGIKKSTSQMDDNYVFVGDFHTSRFAFEKYNFDYHFVKVSQRNLTTSEMLNHMKDMVYDYNPSIVFIEIGIMDLDGGITEEQFIQNYSKIIELISMNRPNALIVVESIYPVNQQLYDEDFFHNKIMNKDIENFNKGLKSLATDKNVKYLDIYSSLLESGDLNPKYTEDGINLNSNGYQIVYKEIKSVVG